MQKFLLPRRAPFALPVLLALVTLGMGGPLIAQETSPSPAASADPTTSPAPEEALTAEEINDLGEAAPIVQALRQKKNKTVALIFDVSGSMAGDTGSGKMLRRARTVAALISRRALRPGDEALLYTFGAGYDVYKQRIESGDDRDTFADHIPSQTGEGAGTNIRRPHREALKQIEASLAAQPNRPAAVIILTDSFNDEPRKTDAQYADYVRYYVPGQLNKYPNTEENRDYERLLRELVQSGKVKQYGIGVAIAPSGRPIERVPQAAATPIPAPTVEATPTPLAATKPEEKPFPYLWVILGVLAVGGVGYFLLAGSRPVSLRISGGSGGAKNFQLRGGQSVRIGGDGANFAPDAYAVPGVKEPVALLRAGRGGLMLAPPSAAKAKPVGAAAGSPPTAGGNQTTGPRVFHNGVLLEQETPIGFGDEIRISVPADAGGLSKDVRLKISDPRQNF